MNDNVKLIVEIEKNGIGSGGKNALLKYLKGESIHRSAAIKAKCFECCGYYGDGRVDCNIPTCPLYPFMPYKNKNVDEEIEIEDELDNNR